ncbi:hypothetical protein NPIL_115091 [Nephila pilipes]|uniref:Uncharacterized protein n=1 Tax=Nephila pilipes TaxID=299642 RepID=A0A8X6MAN6_NEPPI|nr:hypothetical protein NPIL_115091 [Nephila pilipes]
MKLQRKSPSSSYEGTYGTRYYWQMFLRISHNEHEINLLLEITPREKCDAGVRVMGPFKQAKRHRFKKVGSSLKMALNQQVPRLNLSDNLVDYFTDRRNTQSRNLIDSDVVYSQCLANDVLRH